ncbi:uncharacterized protein BCR38DRAFT_405181 [Pseudomassariella vexata]|uniref:Uncharacterized protein n=1 Tax=Pseudomassariella vexata TaxID=1141098 RepID=A0A1Y2ED12_9PEZI|nr:uncharacterized protein BCR38DRAFT_405181 [Pseudomassariella vexata]ORY69461.1 hypothetical protein BCR38DRAFT_405181 [Pseudomassariella vexata]
MDTTLETGQFHATSIDDVLTASGPVTLAALSVPGNTTENIGQPAIEEADITLQVSTEPPNSVPSVWDGILAHSSTKTQNSTKLHAPQARQPVNCAPASTPLATFQGFNQVVKSDWCVFKRRHLTRCS